MLSASVACSTPSCVLRGEPARGRHFRHAAEQTLFRACDQKLIARVTTNAAPRRSAPVFVGALRGKSLLIARAGPRNGR